MSRFYNNYDSMRGHVCGLYYNVPAQGWLQKTYLPQVELQAHAIILGTTSRTELRQTFVNPSKEKGIKEVRYTFPLYDGVSVVGFTCHIGDRKIVGEVKEKDKARAVFKEAVAKGQTAGIFEQLPEASDVFTTTVGNIPPGAKVVVDVTYLGELKHDMEVDGTRFTIPNIICPRYGNYPPAMKTAAVEAVGGTISIIVDMDMADGSSIQKLQSPTHPISMTMGTTSIAPKANPTMTKASVSLTLGKTELEKDFVLQIIAKNTGVPKAILENHPNILNQRALMATLVPKFKLPAEKPELVFVIDRSGSMSGSNINLVKQALGVFLKSLPVGVKFNICSFGSHHSFLWQKSVTYRQQTLEEALYHAETLEANYGGTEMLAPLKATIEQRYKDMPLDIMLLTDGEIWNQSELFSYLNQSIIESKAPIRLFTLGIGNGVSHALIEGVAKAGNGFSQTVGQGEAMDTKVVRMLKGALSPHVTDYTLEVKYTNDSSMAEDDEDFEIIEKVADSLNVKLNLEESKLQSTNPISLFDTTANEDEEESPIEDKTSEQRYAHLPKVSTPNIIQAPQNIPSLFAFNRTTVYLLLGPEAPKATPRAVVLRGTSKHGPLELEIPIEIMAQPGETIHQLAAKKAISELEQGRGWLLEAKDDSGALVKNKFEGHFDDMVEREAVRLGVQFQVGGKWCSFVAVESEDKKEKERKDMGGWEWLEDEIPTDIHPQGLFGGLNPQSQRKSRFFSYSSSESSDDDGFMSCGSRSRPSRRMESAFDRDSNSEDCHSGPDDGGAFRFIKYAGSDSEEEACMAVQDPDVSHPVQEPPKVEEVIKSKSDKPHNPFASTPLPLPLGASAFGSTAQPLPAGHLFGGHQPNQPGLFGNLQPGAPSRAPQSGGLFGAAQSGGLFGAAQSGGLFGAAQSGGLFGAPRPPTHSGFASPTPPAGGLFGSSQSHPPGSSSAFSYGSAPPGPKPGGLFGASSPAPQSGGLFGASSPAPQVGGLFGASRPMITPQPTAASPPVAFGSVAPPPPPGGSSTSQTANLFRAPPSGLAPQATGFGSMVNSGSASPPPATSLFGNIGHGLPLQLQQQQQKQQQAQAIAQHHQQYQMQAQQQAAMRQAQQQAFMNAQSQSQRQSISPQSQAPGVPAGPPSGARPSQAKPQTLPEYQMGLMILEQQNKKRLLMARQEQDNASTPVSPSSAPPATKTQALEEYQMQPATLERESLNRTMPGARQDMDVSATHPPPPPPPPLSQPAGFGSLPLQARESDYYSITFGSTQSKLSKESDTGDPAMDDGALENFDFDSFLHHEGAEDDTMDFELSSPGYEAAPPLPPAYSPAIPSPDTAPHDSSKFVNQQPEPQWFGGNDEQFTRFLISYQTFEGSWNVTSSVLGPLKIRKEDLESESKKVGLDEKVFFTAVVVATFEKKLRTHEGIWELLVDKAMGWLGEQVDDVEDLVEKAGRLVKM